MQVARFLQDDAAFKQAGYDLAGCVAEAVRSSAEGDTVSNLFAMQVRFKSNATVPVFDSDLVHTLRSLDPSGLSEVMQHVSLYDASLLPFPSLFRPAAITSRVTAGDTLDLSRALALGNTEAAASPANNCSLLRQYAPHCSALRLLSLDLSHNFISDKAAPALASILASQPHLRRLDLSETNGEQGSLKDVMAVVAVATDLTFLCMHAATLMPPSPVWATIGHLKQLAHLDLHLRFIRYPDLDPDINGLHRTLAELSRLTHLRLDCQRLPLSGQLLPLLRLLPDSLRHLELNWPWLGFRPRFAPEVLSRLTGLTNLHLGRREDRIYSGPLKDHTLPSPRCAAVIASLPHLRRFSAATTAMPARALVPLARSPSLRHLALVPVDCGITALTRLTSLYLDLTLWRGRLTVQERFFSCFNSLTALRHLHLTGTACVALLKGLPTALSACTAALEDLEVVVRMGDMPLAEVFNAPRHPVVPMFSRLTSLTRLCVLGWLHQAGGTRELAAALRPLRALRMLCVENVEHCVGLRCSACMYRIQGRSRHWRKERKMAYLLAVRAANGAGLGRTLAGLTQLTHLSLGGPCVPDGAAMIAALRPLGALRALSLTDAALGTKAAAALSALLCAGAMPEVSSLDLSGNRLSGAGIAALAEGLLSLRQLRPLTLWRQCGHAPMDVHRRVYGHTCSSAKEGGRRAGGPGGGEVCRQPRARWEEASVYSTVQSQQGFQEDGTAVAAVAGRRETAVDVDMDARAPGARTRPDDVVGFSKRARWGDEPGEVLADKPMGLGESAGQGLRRRCRRRHRRRRQRSMYMCSCWWLWWHAGRLRGGER